MASVASTRARSIGLQGSGVFEEIEAIACPPALAHLQEKAFESDRAMANQDVAPTINSHIPRRYLRRRFQQLLARVPILLYNEQPQASARSTKSTDLGPPPGRYKVALSPLAAARNGPIQAVADDVDMAWIALSEEQKGAQGKRK